MKIIYDVCINHYSHKDVAKFNFVSQPLVSSIIRKFTQKPTFIWELNHQQEINQSLKEKIAKIVLELINNNEPIRNAYQIKSALPKSI